MGWLKAANVPLSFLRLPIESGTTPDFVPLKSNPRWPPHAQRCPGCISAPNQLSPCLSFPAPSSSLQTAAVSMVSVTIVQAVGVCVRVARVPQASAAASATSPQGTVGPRSRPRTATCTPAV